MPAPNAESGNRLSQPAILFIVLLLEIAGFGFPASVAPEACKACGGTKLKRPCSLPAADLECASITSFALTVLPARHKQPTPEAVQFGLPPTLTAHLCRGEPIPQQFLGLPILIH